MSLLDTYTCALIVPNEAIKFDHFPVCIGTVEDINNPNP